MGQTVRELAVGFLALMSILGFMLMGIDKQRAKQKAWRIPERTLLFIALFGGGIGSFLGMYAFRHKTKHARFIILLPLTAALDLLVILKLFHII